MDKVLVERPRRGGHGARKGRPPRDLEDLPAFKGLRRQAKERGDFKTLNENLQPLRRYLERQLGRPWNKVYSEMRARIDPGNEVQAHVLTHLENFIHLRVTKVEPSAQALCGLIFQPAHSWEGRFRAVEAGDLYVDPDDGIIKRARRRFHAAPSAAQEPGVRRLGPDLAAIRAQGVWYLAELADFEVIEIDGESGRGKWRAIRVSDRLYQGGPGPIREFGWGRELSEVPGIADLYKGGKLPVGKRQLSRRELKQYGLSNAAKASA